MQKVSCDVLVIGGGPGGSVCAMTAKINYPDKEILVIREFEVQLVPCAIPYIFGETLGCSEKDVASCGMAADMGISTLLGTVENVDISNKVAYSQEHEISFDKLVFATGSKPFVHSSLQHALDLQGVFSVPKDKVLIDKAKAYIDTIDELVVVGTGFIGVEMAMEFAESGKKVTLVGGSKHILKGAFDPEIAIQAEEIVLKRGLHFVGEDRVKSIGDTDGDGVVSTVTLASGKIIKTQAVILATGYQPNTKLAEEAGVSLGHYTGIWVDDYMKTENPDIFAVGDCCARRGFITKIPSKVMLASTSAAEGRIAGSSLYGIKFIRGFSGTIAIFSTMIGDTAFSSAGITEDEAICTDTDVVMATFSGINRHPATIPGAQKQVVKLVAIRNGGQIIGGQVIGGEETAEMINAIGLMIEAQLSVYQVMSLQVSSQPRLTAAPTSNPITMAATMIAHKISNS